MSVLTFRPAKLVFGFLALAVFATAIHADDALPTARIARFDGDRAAAISYTFDDNLRDQWTLAVPMLNEVGFKATFFVIPGATAETTEEAEKNAAKKRAWGGISWPELKAMSAQGHEIASHTWSHPNLGKLAPEAVEEQFAKASSEIEKRIGQKPLTVALPFNFSTPAIEAAALKYHVAFRDSQLGISAKTSVESLRKWANTQVAEKKWGVLMFHAVGTGYAALSDPEILRAHLQEIKARDREIWVDTFANIARYQRERDDAKLSLSGKAGSVTCVLSGTLDPQLYNVPLTLVLEAKSAKTARAVRNGRELPTRVENGAILIQAAPSAQPIALFWK